MSYINNPSNDTLGISNLGNTAGTSGVASGPSIELLLAGGNNITLSQSLNGSSATVTIIGPAVPAATNFSLDGTSSSVSLSAGANIGIGQAASTITISASNQSVLFAMDTLTAGGSTSGATNTASSTKYLIAAGSNITLSQASTSPEITIIGPAPSGGAGFTLNGTSSTVSISAGAGIGIGQAASTITISASVQTSLVSMTGLGNTTVSSSGTFSNLLNISGAGGISVGMGAGSITISGPTVPAATNFSLNGTSSSVSLVAGANIGFASGASSITISAGPLVNSIGAAGSLSSGPITISGVNITVSSNGAGVIQLSAGAGGAAGTNTISASGTSIAGTALSLALAAGANISLQTATAAGSMTISISGENAVSVIGLASSTGTLSLNSGPGISLSLNGANGQVLVQTSGNFLNAFGISSLTAGGVTQGTTTLATGTVELVAGSNITLSSSAGNITIIGPAAAGGGTISLTQNVPLQAAGLLTSTSGTLTGTAAFGSSLFLQRVFIPGTLNLTEADLALGMSFNATSNGAGTLSRSFVVYSFGNSTSLASVLSFSSTSAWATGTSTTAGAVSLTAFQGGWAGTLLRPMTFAVTSLAAGEYVVGNLINFAQGSSTWTLSVYGQNMAALSSAAVVTGIGTSTTSYYSSIAQLVVNNVELSSNTFAGTAVSGFTSATSISTKSISVSSRTLLTASTTTGNLISSVSGLTGTITFLSTSTEPSFGFIGTGSTTSAFPFWFSAGIMSTGAVPVAITLTSTAVTYSGSTAMVQPWWALAGS